MPCALLSILTGMVSLVVTFLLWWRGLPADITRIGEHVGLFSALLGLLLAGIASVSPRKLVRRLAIVAVTLNVAILCLTIDAMFSLSR